MTRDYPAADFPWTLYFHGVEMPKWSNCWGFLPLPEKHPDWDAGLVYSRIDHVGQVESEEADTFIVAAQQMLLASVDQYEGFLHRAAAEVPTESLELAYQNLQSGLRQMILLAEKETVVFWAGGYTDAADLAREAVRRFKLGHGSPDYLEPPHRLTRARDRALTIDLQRTLLRRHVSEGGGLDKSMRRFVLELPKRTEG